MKSAPWTLALTVLVAPYQAQAQAPTPVAFEVTLNGESRGTVLLLQRGTEFLVSQDEARAWRLRVPERPDLSFRGQGFHTLSSLGLSVSRLDTGALRIELRAEPSAFEASVANLGGSEYRLTPAAWGGFASYDFVANRIEGVNAIDGAFTVSAFAPYGSLSYQFVERNLWSDGSARHDSVRIATTYRHDWAESMMSLEAGDTVSRPGAFGRALRYGGLNVGSNFSLRPGFIRQPLPELSAQASLPSTVEVFVQNQLRSVTQVPAGPFTLDNVPVISGAGDARVVVRDALGRESVVTSSFYVAGGLLRKGLTEWNAGAGKLRNDVGGDANYERGYGTALVRHGITSWLTAEGRAEVESERTKVIGGAIDVGGLWGEIEATAGFANVDGVGNRFLGGLGYRYVTLDYNVGLRWVEAQRGFRLPGDTDFEPTPARVVTLNGGARLSDRWSAGIAWLGTERQSGLDTRSLNLSATFSMTRHASVLFAYNRLTEGGIARNVGSVLLSVALGNQTSATAGVDFGSSGRQFAGVQRALPFDEGWGYRALATHNSDRTRMEAGAAVNLSAATVSAEVVGEVQRSVAARLGVAGSVALIEDKAFTAREITDSFALVRVPGVPDAPILLNNQPAGSTDAAGRLVLPRLTPYVPHQIRVDVDALPPDAEIVRDRETTVPPYRSGVVVTLGIRRTAAALVKAIDGKGRPIAAGAAVAIEPDGTATSVAQGGAFFVRADPGRKRATVTSRGEQCTIEFDLALSDVGAYRTLGPYECVR
ncbi:MAG: fimbria/pilus outer membrane usher protein [Burkholderiaceae bacterium]|nr:fimbria/pilus outer membrane usher protein [Burkholderiaceae bacterium]